MRLELRSTTSVMVASKDLPLLVQTVLVSPTRFWGRATFSVLADVIQGWVG